MTPLTQQLEDKKKGCENDTKYMHGMNTLLDKKCGEYPFKDKGLPIIYCPNCQAEIAILEQAIAEIKRQIQEEIEFLKEIYNKPYVSTLTEKIKRRMEYLDEKD